MNIELVVFDIAGTTVRDNNEVGEAFRATMAKFGYDIPLATINAYMGYEKNEAIRAIIRTHSNGRELADPSAVDTIHRAFVGRMVRYYETADDIAPLPHVEETFSVLRDRGVKIALNTGFSRNIANIIVDRLGWFERQLIDSMVASDEVPHGRPSPDMIHTLMRRTGVDDIARVAKVGDTEVDINEGKNAGCRYVIGVTTGAYTREALASYGPTHILDDIRGVLDIIHP